MEGREVPGDRGVAALWPVTVGSPLARAARRVVGPLFVVLGSLVSVPLAVPFAPPLTKQLRELNRGRPVTFEAIVIGSSTWCPRYPDPHKVRLTSRSAVLTLGNRDRAIPLTRLTPTGLHRPRAKQGLESLPRSCWVVDLDGPGGPGSIAARLDDLALLAAVAGWPPPPELTRLAG
jgi:hypothetical protein